MTDLITHLSNITDPRSALGKRHSLVEIIIIAICGINSFLHIPNPQNSLNCEGWNST